MMSQPRKQKYRRKRGKQQNSAEECNDSPQSPLGSPELSPNSQYSDDANQLRAQIQKLIEERDEHDERVRGQCETLLVETKRAHQNAILNLETEIETAMRAQLSAESRRASDLMDGQLKEMKAAYEESQVTNKRIQTELEKANWRLKQATRRNEELEVKNTLHETQITQIMNETQGYAEMSARLADIEPKYTSCLEDLQNLTAECSMLQDRLESERLKHLKSRADSDSQIARIEREHSNVINDLEERLNLYTSELEDAKQLAMSIAQEKSSLQHEYDQIRSQNAQYDDMVQEIRSQEHQSRENIQGEYLEEINQLQEEITQLRQKAEFNEFAALNRGECESQTILETNSAIVGTEDPEESNNVIDLQTELAETKSKIKSLQNELKRVLKQSNLSITTDSSFSLCSDDSKCNELLPPKRSSRIDTAIDEDMKIEYIRQTILQFIGRPGTRKQLVPIICALLECAENERQIFLQFAQ